MTPAQEAVSKITAPVDTLLAQVAAAVTRIEAKHAGERQDLLAVVAELIASDDRFRYAIIALAVD